MSLRQESRYAWLEPRLIAPIVIATAVVWSTSLVTKAWRSSPETPRLPQTMEISGNAVRHFQPDKLAWSVTVHGSGDTEEAARSALRSNLAALHDYLVAHEIEESELSYEQPAIDTSTQSSDNTESGTPEVSTIAATQEVDIAPRDISRGLRAQHAVAATDELAELDVGDANCTSRPADAIKDQLLVEARANVYATAMMTLGQYHGGELGRVLNASQGSVDVGSDCADIVVTATAAATYEIE